VVNRVVAIAQSGLIPKVVCRKPLLRFFEKALIRFRWSSMKSKAEPSFASQIPSVAMICFSSIVSGLAIFLIAVVLQWFIYDDWMHKNGPLRLVGSALASAWAFGFVYQWQLGQRKKKIENLRRFETIKWMNDRIRNSLQAIECVVYATSRHVTDPVRDAVDTIESVLQEVLVETDTVLSARVKKTIGNTALREDRQED